MLSLRRIKKLLKWRDKGYLKNSLNLASIVNVWFNNRHQREDSATLTAAVTTNDDVVV